MTLDIGKSSRTFGPDRGSADPNPGAYGAQFRKNGEYEHVQGPDWGWSGSGKMGFREVVSGGGLQREWGNSGAGIFVAGKIFLENVSEKFFGNYF
jgi:hypothetical protein